MFLNDEERRKVAFCQQFCDAAYVNALVDLVSACRKYGTKINRVDRYQEGWSVTFENIDGDTICHNGSYGSPCYGGLYDDSRYKNDWTNTTGRWETIGMPWDHGDVSVHESEWLAEAISRIQKGEAYNENWEYGRF